MKKILVLVVLIISVITSYSQNSEVNKELILQIMASVEEDGQQSLFLRSRHSQKLSDMQYYQTSKGSYIYVMFEDNHAEMHKVKHGTYIALYNSNDREKFFFAMIDSNNMSNPGRSDRKNKNKK